MLVSRLLPTLTYMILGIDIGGTKTLIASFNEHGKVQHKVQFPTEKDLDQFFGHLITTIDSEFDLASLTAIGLAAPGTVGRTPGIITRFGNLDWENVDFRHPLEDHYRVPVLVNNDANVAGLAEARALADMPDNVLYITLSTGINAGIIIRGRIDPATAQSEAGFMAIPHEGSLQPWEKFASGSAFTERFNSLASEANDPAIWEEYTKSLVPGFSALISILHPDIVIVGGGLGVNLEKFHDFLVEQLNDAHPSHMVDIPPIQKVKHPSEAVVYGCYELAADHVRHNRS